MLRFARAAAATTTLPIIANYYLLLHPSRILHCDHANTNQSFLFRTEPATGIQFPINATSGDSHQLRLLGLGVRQITYFRFNTYAAGIYADPRVSFSASSSPPPPPQQQQQQQQATPNNESIAKTLFRQPYPIMVKILCARATSSIHMKNAFTRMLNERLSKDAGIAQSPEATAAAKESIDELARAFPKSPLAVGHDLSFCRDGDQGDQLTVYYQGQWQATIKSRWLADNFILAYLADSNNVLIPGLVKDIVDHLPNNI